MKYTEIFWRGTARIWYNSCLISLELRLRRVDKGTVSFVSTGTSTTRCHVVYPCRPGVSFETTLGTRKSGVPGSVPGLLGYRVEWTQWLSDVYSLTGTPGIIVAPRVVVFSRKTNDTKYEETYGRSISNRITSSTTTDRSVERVVLIRREGLRLGDGGDLRSVRLSEDVKLKPKWPDKDK